MKLQGALCALCVILDIRSLSAILGAYFFFEKNTFCLLALPKKMSFLIIFIIIFFFKTLCIKLGEVVHSTKIEMGTSLLLNEKKTSPNQFIKYYDSIT